MPTEAQQYLGGAEDRPWHLRAWSGMTFPVWFRILAGNRFAVSPSRIPMALILTAMSICNSFLSAVQSLVYARRISEARLVEDPIFILGHWRSGTTLLHELFACDPRYTFPDTCSCFAPNHFLLTSRVLKRILSLFLPSKRPMDDMEMRWESPQEDEWALCNMGMQSPYFIILFPSSWCRKSNLLDALSLRAQDSEEWKAGLLWFLKCLSLRDAKPIVLKSPPHTCRIPMLLEAFPKARFVHIVRNPFDVFPSTVHTWKRLFRYHGLQVPQYEGLEECVLAAFCRMYGTFEESRPLMDPGCLVEIHYEDLAKDPVTQMEMIYDKLGLGDFELLRPKVEDFAARMSGYQPNRYEVSERMRQQIAEKCSGFMLKYGYKI